MITQLETYMREFDVQTGAFRRTSIYSVHMIDSDFMTYVWAPEVC